MPSVYVETTIPSYLAAAPSRDLIVAGQQQITHTWWQTARERFELFISEAVLQEIRAGDPVAAARRMELVKELAVLDVTKEADSLVEIYQRQFNLPHRAKADMVHIAVAVVYELDYVVTWNCKHIANWQILRRLMEVNHSLGRFTPLLYTPAEFLELPAQEGDSL
jgi:predicted nucleic acid-binding protein